MGTATAGSGVAFFRSLFPKDYYAYDAGTLMSVQAKEHRTVGFNQWDEEWEKGTYDATTGEKINEDTRIRSKNKIRVIPGSTYCFLKRLSFFQYGISGNYLRTSGFVGTDTGFDTITLGNDCYYIAFCATSTYGVTYKDDICINLSDSSKNGTYEPYEEHVYPLDSDLVLRGIPKLDSDGNLYYDGDEYTPDGSVKRRYRIVDLGTLEWSFQSGTNRFYSGTISNSIKTNYSGSYNLNLVCTDYTPVDNAESDRSICAMNSSGNVFIKDARYATSSTEAFKTAMSGVYLVYELKTPTTEQADPYHEIQICSRYGTEEFVDAAATAETDPRDVAIPVGTETLYPVNVFDYIEELTQPDHDMVADANIASGKYFMVGNSLYISTEAIEQGAAIVPGTNCTAVSLAEALNTINT
jgi:hypothetical protein